MCRPGAKLVRIYQQHISLLRSLVSSQFALTINISLLRSSTPISLSALSLCDLTLMRQRIKDVVDAEFVSGVRVVNRLERVIRPLPPIANVVVVVDDHHQAAVLVFDAQELRPAGLAIGRA